MSPCRTLQWRRPARSSRARASASMSSDRSMPRPRSIVGPNSSSMRPVPVPRSSSERNGLLAERLADRRLDRFVGDVQRADAVPFARRARGNSLRRRRARARAPRRAARGRASASDRRGSSRADQRAGELGAAPPCSASRKNAQAPSRRRSTRPASASSLRWREMRGCDWRRMSVRSETVSSASASSARRRSRVVLAGGLERAVEGVERQWADRSWVASGLWSQSTRI